MAKMMLNFSQTTSLVGFINSFGHVVYFFFFLHRVRTFALHACILLYDPLHAKLSESPPIYLVAGTNHSKVISHWVIPLVCNVRSQWYETVVSCQTQVLPKNSGVAKVGRSQNLSPQIPTNRRRRKYTYSVYKAPKWMVKPHPPWKSAWLHHWSRL